MRDESIKRLKMIISIGEEQAIPKTIGRIRCESEAMFKRYNTSGVSYELYHKEYKWVSVYSILNKPSDGLIFFSIYFRLKQSKVPLDERLTELENSILKSKVQMADLQQTLPMENGVYLKIILGNVNVSILNREEK